MNEGCHEITASFAWRRMQNRGRDQLPILKYKHHALRSTSFMVAPLPERFTNHALPLLRVRHCCIIAFLLCLSSPPRDANTRSKINPSPADQYKRKGMLTISLESLPDFQKTAAFEIGYFLAGMELV